MARLDRDASAANIAFDEAGRGDRSSSTAWPRRATACASRGRARWRCRMRLRSRLMQAPLGCAAGRAWEICAARRAWRSRAAGRGRGARRRAMSARGMLVILAGPTASGNAALACARSPARSTPRCFGHSPQCYRGLDAGTAKPTREEQAQARHHLLDIAWPEEQLDTAQFIAHADAAIEEVRARGKRVLVAGGTGLWIRALVQGLVEGAAGRDEAFRAGFRVRLAREGLPALFSELSGSIPKPRGASSPAIARHRARPRGPGEERPDALVAAARAPLRRAEIPRSRGPARPSARAALAADRGAHAGALFTGPRRRRGAALARDARAARPRARDPRRKESARHHRLRRGGRGAAGARSGCLRRVYRGGRRPARRLARAARGLLAPALDAACTLVCARTRQYAKRQRTWFRKDAPALDETGAPLPWPPPGDADPEAARNSLCSTLREGT